MKQPICAGSNRPGHIGVFPGDEDRCVTCGKWMVVKTDGTIRRHRRPVKLWNQRAPKEA